VIGLLDGTLTGAPPRYPTLLRPAATQLPERGLL
jgi:hypothetical protein